MSPGDPAPADTVIGEAQSPDRPAPFDTPAPFGTLLRWHRRCAAMTQAELAERAGLGVRTVRDLERGRAARPQRTTVDLLARALRLAGDELTGFFSAARGQIPRSRSESAATPMPALPEAPPLIGRAGEVAALVDHLIATPGLTTLVGLAGVGKSALALTVVHECKPAFPGGVAGVNIAENDTIADVAEIVRTVLGVSRDDLLSQRLAEPVLVMVDAAERSASAVRAVLGDLLSASPQLRVVASSRAPLDLPGETVWLVRPLAVPAERVTTLDEARRYPAGELFLDRWAKVRGQEPADVEVDAVVNLVRRLGGLPLAIELAAARGRVLDPPEMLARYGDRLLELGVPMGGVSEAATLRDVVTASYRLLDPAHRWVLRRLSAFAYRWSIELAEQMSTCSPYPNIDLVRALERLVELGLVQVRGAGALRFMLLDVVKAFAVEQAQASGELPEIRHRHATIFAEYAARLAPDLVGAKLSESVQRLDDVASDLWAALAYSANDDPHTALRLASKLPRWWRFRGRDQEGRQWLLRLLDDERTADVDPTVRTWAQLGVAQLALEHGAGPQEVHRADQALREFMSRGDITGELAARVLLLTVNQSVGAFEEARRHGEAALTLATRTGRVRDMAVAQNNLIWHDLRAADLGTAQRRLAAVDRLSVRCGEHKLRAMARANLAEVLRLDGRYEESIQVGRQAAQLLADVGDPSHRHRLLGVIGLSYALDRRFDEAEQVLAQLREHLFERSGDEPRPVHGSDAGQPGTADNVCPEDWDCAMIEATLARLRGQRTLAAAWYASAARQSNGVSDVRDVVEALVGLAATSEDPEPRRRLHELCASAGITLTGRELSLLG